MGPIWGRQDPGGPHVGPMNLAIWGDVILQKYSHLIDVHPCTPCLVRQRADTGNWSAHHGSLLPHWAEACREEWSALTGKPLHWWKHRGYNNLVNICGIFELTATTAFDDGSAATSAIVQLPYSTSESHCVYWQIIWLNFQFFIYFCSK